MPSQAQLGIQVNRGTRSRCELIARQMPLQLPNKKHWPMKPLVAVAILTSDCTKAHSYMLGSPCRPSRVLSAMRAAAYAMLSVALPPPALASTTSVPASCRP